MLHADKNAHNGGYLIGIWIFLRFIFVAAVVAQISPKKFNPWHYFDAIVASTTVGTTMPTSSTASLGIGYTGGSSLLLALRSGLVGCSGISRARLDQCPNRRDAEGGNLLTGSRSRFRRRSAPLSGTGMADDTGLGFGGAALGFEPSPCSPPSIIGQAFASLPVLGVLSS